MKIVERATQPPGKCLISSDIDGPFVDTETWASEIDPYIYLHVPVVEQMGRLVGMVPKAEVEGALERVRAMEGEIEALRRKIAAYEEIRAEIKELDPVAA